MVNWRKEHFRVDLDEIERVINMNHDTTVKLNHVYYAEQYRETLVYLNNLDKLRNDDEKRLST
jgi:hypothetical protein